MHPSSTICLCSSVFQRWVSTPPYPSRPTLRSQSENGLDLGPSRSCASCETESPCSPPVVFEAFRLWPTGLFGAGHSRPRINRWKNFSTEATVERSIRRAQAVWAQGLLQRYQLMLVREDMKITPNASEREVAEC